MKTILFLLLLSIMSLSTFAQDIADVKQEGSSTLITLKSSGAEIARRTLNSSESLAGFSSSIVVIVYDNRTVISYDQNFKEIARLTLNDGDSVKNVSGNNILIRRPGAVITYDKNFKEISRRSE